MDMKMNVKMVSVSDIKPYENNPRINNDAIEPVKKSIQEFGFRNPMILDKDNVIIAGHTRYAAAKELGMKKVPVIYADDLTEDQVRAFRIADNKTSDFSVWDNKKLLLELDGLDDIFTGFEIGDVFGLLDEEDNSVLLENDNGVTYEITFASEDKEKIDRVKEYWENMDNEQQDSGS